MDFVGTRPVVCELGLEELDVCVRLRALADGGIRMVHPRPAANGEFGDRTYCVGESGEFSVPREKRWEYGVRGRYRMCAAAGRSPNRSK